MSSGYGMAAYLLNTMWSCVFWIQHGRVSSGYHMAACLLDGCCIHELTAAVVTDTRLTHDKASQRSNMGGEGVPEASLIPAALPC